MNSILIHKSDSTIFANVNKFLTFNLETNLDLTGWQAKFILGWVEKTVDDISSHSFEIVLSAEDTKQLRLGKQYGTIILTDANGNIKTVTNTIPFEVTTAVVENEYQEIDLTIPKSSGVDIKLKVGMQGGTGAVNSVNGMTGDVVINIPSIEGLATEQQLQQGLDTKQDKGNYALVVDIPTQVSQLENDINYATQTQVMQAIASIPQFSLSIVEELPLAGEKMVLYLVPREETRYDGTKHDVYDEYIWIEQTVSYEHLGSTAPDLTDYVKNTDYATSSKAGVIKAYTQNGFGVNYLGQPFSQTINLASYKSYGGNFFIGKGTLEAIKYDFVRDGIVNNNFSLGEADRQKARNWLGASAEVIQHDSFSSYPADRNIDKICQYIGETTEEFVNGYFYKSTAGESTYVSADPRNITFNYDLFWSELENAGITLDTLRLGEAEKVRGGFSIMGTSESETEYRVTNINGITVDVLLTQSVQSSQNIIGTSTRWYYTYSTPYEWKPIAVQPSAKTVLTTEADYEALETKDPNTLYLIEE